MSLQFVDYVKIQTPTIGAGAITLGNAVPGFRGVEALTDGNSYDYSIQQGNLAYEVGTGTYHVSGHVFTRMPLFSSLAGNAPIPLIGFAVVTFTILADRFNPIGGRSIAADGLMPVPLSLGYNGIDNIGFRPITCTLPSLPGDNDAVSVKDETETADVYSITITGGVIEEGCSVIGVKGGFVNLNYRAAVGKWMQVP